MDLKCGRALLPQYPLTFAHASGRRCGVTGVYLLVIAARNDLLITAGRPLDTVGIDHSVTRNPAICTARALFWSSLEAETLSSAFLSAQFCFGAGERLPVSEASFLPGIWQPQPNRHDALITYIKASHHIRARFSP